MKKKVLPINKINRINNVDIKVNMPEIKMDNIKHLLNFNIYEEEVKSNEIKIVNNDENYINRLALRTGIKFDDSTDDSIDEDSPKSNATVETLLLKLKKVV